MELCSSEEVKFYLKIENDPQKMNSASLNVEIFSSVILTSPSFLSKKKNEIRVNI